jgi:hypothetical protein
MIEKKFIAALAIELTRRFTVIFSLTIIAISITGMLIGLNGQDMRDASTLFLINNGLRYSTISQLAGFSLILALFLVLLFSEYIQTKKNYLFRGFLLLLATLVNASIFAIIFNWFPHDNIQAWINFVLCTIFCFVICLALTLLKLKLEGKKYAKLLADYKAKRNI